MSDLPQLDGPELLHLALEAARRDDHGTAITYLKQAIDLPEGSTATSTDYAKLVYMLGAEYAQIGLIDRAVEHMTRALDIEPELHTARFQLGLLLLSCGQPEPSLQVLAPLQKLGPNSALFHLRDGLEHLIRDEFAPCRESLLKGMALNASSASPNMALNGDMQKLLNALPAQGDEAVAAAIEAAPSTAEADFLRSAYSKDQRHN